MSNRMPVRGRGSNQHADKPPEPKLDQTAAGGVQHVANAATAAATADPLAEPSPPADRGRVDADRSSDDAVVPTGDGPLPLGELRDDYPPDELAVHLEVTNALRDTGWADDDIHQLYNLESCGGRDVETHELLDDPADIAEQVLEVPERNGNRIIRATVRGHGTVTGIVEGADAVSDDGHARVILTIPDHHGDHRIVRVSTEDADWMTP